MSSSSEEGQEQGLQRLQRGNRVKKEVEKQLVSWLLLLGSLDDLCERLREKRNNYKKKKKWKGGD